MKGNIATIFLAEDNEADVFLVRTALEEEGLQFHLRAFSDGEEMLRLLEELDSVSEHPASPELFILDLNLPRYSGEEILDRIQKSPRCCNSPVIVLTSSDSPKDRQRAASRGVSAFFRKPTDLDEFLSLGKIVRSILDDWHNKKRSAEFI